MENWSPPELGDDKIAFVGTQSGTATATFPPLNSANKDSPAKEQSEGRKRVTVNELDALLLEAKEQAYKDGLQQGIEAGERQGREEALRVGQQLAAEQLTSALSAISKLEENLPTALNVHNKEERRLMLQLIEKMVCSVTRAELRMGANNLESIMEQALSTLSDHDQVIEVRVCESDYQTLEQYQSDGQWRLVSDACLETGDCIVESRRALLDHTVQHRIDEALAALQTQLGNVGGDVA
ncbi:MAG: FliH/SctL family protein [Pseudomonadales bacterium]